MTRMSKQYPGRAVGDWCPGSNDRTLSTGEIVEGRARCRKCGRVIGVRKNIYGTNLGIARHKLTE